jgi:protein-L-isoaspartate(D-aspartate) O-methyltransferase
MENPLSVNDEREGKFLSLRFRMVEEQLVRRGINDAAVLGAMRSVPRHLFVSESLQSEAYDDHPVSIGHDQTISQPYIVAYMLSALDLNRDSKVLEIGTGCGYLTAILAEIVREVWSIEILPALLFRANQTIDRLGFKNIHTMLGDGALGWGGEAPFDAIVVSAAAQSIPEQLIAQLSPQGLMVIPLVKADGSQHLVRVKRTSSGTSVDELLEVRFVPLRKTGLSGS